MTLAEFRAQAHSMRCRYCGHLGLMESERHPNNGGIRGLCSACGRPNTEWLSQSNGKRRPAQGPVDEFWHENGDTCAFCGIVFDECVALHIGRHRQHVVPYAEGGGAGPLIPFCSRCNEMSKAEQARVRDMRRYGADWRTVVERIEKNNPHLTEEAP